MDASNRFESAFASPLTGYAPLEDQKPLVELNARVFRFIYQGQRNGNSCLPYFLGVGESYRNEFVGFIRTSNPEMNFDFSTVPWDDVRQNLLEMRHDEWLEVRELLVAHASHEHPSAIWMADAVAAGCLGGNHLWRDMGLPNRQLLTDLLNTNFGDLAKLNVKDMKWKKFFYKQLCEQEGGYVCRAPTCEQCTAYDDCFGPED